MGNRIRELREEKGMTQVRLSIELEVTQETISAYETGKHNVSMNSLLKMVKLFDAGMDYIMGISGIRKPVVPVGFTDDEIELLGMYRRMDGLQREKALAFMLGLLA
jgi:transcriptional regulator with XRE-family HTH domain